VQLDLGGGLGLIYAPPREASRVDGGGGTLFFQVLNVYKNRSDSKQ